MDELIKRLKAKKFNLFVTLIIALFAALSTAMFAVLENVKSVYTILFRMTISFSLFAIIGYFLADFFEKEYLKNLLNDSDVHDATVDDEKIDEDEVSGVDENLTETDENKLQDTEENSNDETESEGESEEKNLPVFEDDSFDKIVVVDDDAAKDK